MDDPTAVVDEALLTRIIGTFDLSGDGEIERAEVLPAVKRYKASLKHINNLTEMCDRTLSPSPPPSP